MTARPSRLAWLAAVVVAAAVLTGTARGRAEPFLAAVPLLVAFFIARRPDATTVEAAEVVLSAGATPEGSPLAATYGATVADAPGTVEIRPVLPALLGVGGARHALREPDMGGHVAWTRTARGEAVGTMELGVFFLRLRDRLGFWVAELRVETSCRAVVLARARPARTLPEPRRAGAPFGMHPSRRVGGGTDFADIAAFGAGDRLRRINWPVSLRRGDLYVNRAYDERSADVLLLLDTFASVGRRPRSSFDLCLRAAADLAAGYLRQHDRVGLMEFGGWLRWTRPGSGPAQLAAILHALSRAVISRAEFVQDLTRLPETMLSRRTLIVALSPLADPRFGDMLGRLSRHGFDVTLLALRADEVTAPPPRSERGRLARRLWLLERESALRGLRRHGVRTTNWSPREPLEVAAARLRLPEYEGETRWFA